MTPRDDSDATAHDRPSETELLLQEILASYWQALIDAIGAGDQDAVNRHTAVIAQLTGRADSTAAIPDLPSGVQVRGSAGR